MPGSNRRKSQREEMVAIDLGTRTTKAVLLRRVGNDYVLLNYLLADTPAPERVLSQEVWAGHLRKVVRGLGATTRRTVLAVGADHAMLSQVDLPAASASDLRKMIKLNPKVYLQEDLPDHLFDCHVGSTVAQESEAGGLRPRRKSRVLVMSARRSLVEDLTESAREAGLTVETITAVQVATANAFRVARPDALDQPVALVDIGYRSSTISILHDGNPVLTRVVNFGAERFSAVLDQANVGSPADPMEEENPLTDGLQVTVQKAIGALAREIDASIGFYLSQHDQPVSQLFVSGGSARSHFILQTLESELGLPCRNWNPAAGLQLNLPQGKTEEIDYEAPQLVGAVGAALSRMEPDLIELDLLAEQQEEAEWRRRDPVRRAIWAAAMLLAGMGLWAGWLGWQIYDGSQEVNRTERRMALLQQSAGQPLQDAQRAGELERRRQALQQHGQQRFLTAEILNALQYVIVDNIEFHRLTIDRQLRRIDPPRMTARQRRAAGEDQPVQKPVAETREQFVLRIQARNYGDRHDLNRQMDAVANHEYFRRRLREHNPVQFLPGQGGRQVDPMDTARTRTFELFTIECWFAERTFRHE